MYQLRIEKNNELVKSGSFDLEIKASEYAFELLREYWNNMPGDFTTYNGKKDLSDKLNLLNFVHVWDFKRTDGVIFRCMIIKKQNYGNRRNTKAYMEM